MAKEKAIKETCHAYLSNHFGDRWGLFPSGGITFAREVFFEFEDGAIISTTDIWGMDVVIPLPVKIKTYTGNTPKGNGIRLFRKNRATAYSLILPITELPNCIVKETDENALDGDHINHYRTVEFDVIKAEKCANYSPFSLSQYVSPTRISVKIYERCAETEQKIKRGKIQKKLHNDGIYILDYQLKILLEKYNIVRKRK